MTKSYEPRNALVLIRKKKRGLVHGLHMPEVSAEGVDFFVVKVGPDVVDLKPDDQVMLMGKPDETYYPVPGEPSMIICDQKLVAYRIVEQDD